jgi:hypothetical protein
MPMPGVTSGTCLHLYRWVMCRYSLSSTFLAAAAWAAAACSGACAVAKAGVSSKSVATLEMLSKSSSAQWQTRKQQLQMPQVPQDVLLRRPRDKEGKKHKHQRCGGKSQVLVQLLDTVHCHNTFMYVLHAVPNTN